MIRLGEDIRAKIWVKSEVAASQWISNNGGRTMIGLFPFQVRVRVIWAQIHSRTIFRFVKEHLNDQIG